MGELWVCQVSVRSSESPNGASATKIKQNEEVVKRKQDKNHTEKTPAEKCKPYFKPIVQAIDNTINRASICCC